MNVKLRYVWKINYKLKKTIPFHSHNFHEIIYYYHAKGNSQYIKKTKLNESVGIYNTNIEYTSTPQDNLQTLEFSDSYLLHYPPGIVHNETHFDDQSQLICIGFEFENIHGIIPTTAIVDENGFFKSKMDKIVHLNKEKSNYYILSIENQIAEILVELLKETSNKISINSKLDYVINYINDSIVNPISINYLAESIGFSVEHFREIFKKHTGYSPKRYIIDKKIEHAKLLLSNSNISYVEISILCGFSDYTQFSSFFKRETKLSPKEYRKVSNTVSLRISE